MPMSATSTMNLEDRLERVEQHLAQENPVLLDVVKGFRELDQVAYRLGLFDRDESLATRVSWWPVISVLGTFSSGKSTFINHYLGQDLQRTGVQAVDDKFTVICYGGQEKPRILPGLALDHDPRFSFYRISHEIEAIAQGEGQRLDVYLQLKTCNSEELKGKIFIDSPGFDADAQRTATLHITDHIIDLSDLVLVFFDARHPEPGAMRDTLDYLVSGTMERSDFNKFLFVLNQVDTAAREDNPEEIFAAWQQALAQRGLTAGHFYRIYDPERAADIPDERLRQRFEDKRRRDMNDIRDRVHQVEIERGYRVTGTLEETAQAIRDVIIPKLREGRQIWKQRLLWLDGIVFGVIAVVLVAWSIQFGYWNGLTFDPPWRATVTGSPPLFWGIIVVVLGLVAYIHTLLRRAAGRIVIRHFEKEMGHGKLTDWITGAFRKNIRSWKPFWAKEPVGVGRTVNRILTKVLSDADRVVQSLNDRYTQPSGDAEGAEKATDDTQPDVSAEDREKAAGPAA